MIIDQHVQEFFAGKSTYQKDPPLTKEQLEQIYSIGDNMCRWLDEHLQEHGIETKIPTLFAIHNFNQPIVKAHIRIGTTLYGLSTKITETTILNPHINAWTLKSNDINKIGKWSKISNLTKLTKELVRLTKVDLSL